MSDDVRLICGDNLMVLPTLSGIDAVVTDPPYGLALGTNEQRRGWKTKHLGKRAYAGSDDTYEDFVGAIVPRLNAAIGLAKRAAVFTGPHIQEQRKASAIGGIFCPAASGRTCWGFKEFLPILLYGVRQDLHRGSRPTVLRSTAKAEKNGHPCPKPLEWMVWLVEMTTRPGETVLDPFMGSGMTGVACVQTGRRFIGIEIDPAYFAIASQRVAEAQAARSAASAA